MTTISQKQLHDKYPCRYEINQIVCGTSKSLVKPSGKKTIQRS